ncbi:uncharacterized protein LOC135813050 [Sycon ciliatum]|uniref:uncharacterized protein LOC135813050 n=1 Tax=Sycon ciliatum TaxID=27933 RepID=UPI0031F6BFF6
MMLAETFLTTSVSDDILRIQNYTLVRRDRPTHGGGLAAYVRDHLRARIVKADTQVEMLMLEVSGQRSKVLLGGVYRPPGTPVQFWQDLTNALDTVISTLPTSPLVLVGDFNVDVSSRDSPQLNSLLHLCNSFDIKNQVDSPTRIGPQGSQTTLDLALVGDDHVNSCVVVPCTISDHFALALDLRLTTSCTPTVRRGRNIARIDMGQFAHHLLNSDLENFCFARTEDEMWDMWLEKLVAALNTHAPIRLHRPRAPTRKSFPWKTPALHDLVQRRDAAHRRWKASPADPALRNVFTSARDEAKRMSRHLRAIYFGDLLAASQANARKTWQTINYLSGRNKSSVPPAVSVSQLSDQFSGVVSDPTRPLRLSAPLGPTKKECLEEFAPASVQEIAKLLSNIDVRKAAGSDQVPAAILKHCSPVLAPSLTILINASLASGVVPASLKIADVRPLFKSGDKAVAKNYRPISLLPIVSKVLERVVHTRLSAPAAQRPQRQPPKPYRRQESSRWLAPKLPKSTTRCALTGKPRVKVFYVGNVDPECDAKSIAEHCQAQDVHIVQSVVYTSERFRTGFARVTVLASDATTVQDKAFWPDSLGFAVREWRFGADGTAPALT